MLNRRDQRRYGLSRPDRCGRLIFVMSNEDPAEQIEKDLQEKEAKQKLFQEKVVIIGELHTERALWANRIGQLKSLSITQTNELDEGYEDRLKALESQIAEISKEITDFKPDTLDELNAFKDKTRKRFGQLEKDYQELEKQEAEANPDGDQG